MTETDVINTINKSITNPIVVKLDKAIISKSIEFGERVVGSNVYHDNGQTNINARVNQLNYSKMGEEAVYLVLNKILPGISPPDHTLHKKSEKSWDSDLKYNNIGIAIKTWECRMGTVGFPTSWTFQYDPYSPRGRMDKILSEPEAIMMLAIWRGDDSFIILPPLQMKDILPKLKYPKLPKLRSYKQVLYLSDLPAEIQDKVFELGVERKWQSWFFKEFKKNSEQQIAV